MTDLIGIDNKKQPPIKPESTDIVLQPTNKNPPNYAGKFKKNLTTSQKLNVNEYQKSAALAYLQLGWSKSKIARETGLCTKTIKAIKDHETIVNNALTSQIIKRLGNDHLILNSKYGSILHDIHDNPEVRQKLVDNAHVIPVTAVYNRTLEGYLKVSEHEATLSGDHEALQEAKVLNLEKLEQMIKDKMKD